LNDKSGDYIWRKSDRLFCKRRKLVVMAAGKAECDINIPTVDVAEFSHAFHKRPKRRVVLDRAQNSYERALR
jgi:hypothetical protein